MQLDISKLSEKVLELLSLRIFKKEIDKDLLRRDGYDCAGPRSFAFSSTLLVSLLLLSFMILLLMLYRTAFPIVWMKELSLLGVKNRTHTHRLPPIFEIPM